MTRVDSGFGIRASIKTQIFTLCVRTRYCITLVYTCFMRRVTTHSRSAPVRSLSINALRTRRSHHGSLAISAAAKQPTDHCLDAVGDNESGGQFEDEPASRALPLRRRVKPANHGEPLGGGVEHFMRHV